MTRTEWLSFIEAFEDHTMYMTTEAIVSQMRKMLEDWQAEVDQMEDDLRTWYEPI
jgi:hypothetical protein